MALEENCDSRYGIGQKHGIQWLDFQPGCMGDTNSWDQKLWAKSRYQSGDTSRTWYLPINGIASLLQKKVGRFIYTQDKKSRLYT